MWFEIVGVVVIASYQASGGDDKAIYVRDWQDIGRFCLLTPLIGD